MTELDRRDFLKVTATAAGGLLLAAHGVAAGADAERTPPTPQLYIRIDPDNRITLTIPKSEMGQAVRTSLALLIAEELDADWALVQVETASYAAHYLDQGTGGSSSVWEAFDPLRRAGAAMRQMLIAAAAARWKAPASRLRAEASHVVDPTPGSTSGPAAARRASFGELAAAAARQPVPASPACKPRERWALLGKEHVAKDAPDIAHGRARYGLDQRLPGMVFACIERPREFGAALDGFDASAALAVPGVRQVFALEPATPGVRSVVAEIAGGVVVVGATTWAALEGRRRLHVRWKSGPHASESSAAYRRQMADAVDRPGAEVVHQLGDPDAVLAAASRVVRADYEVPFLAHATLEPMNCTAQWDGRRMTLWSPTQDPEQAARSVARRLGLAPDQVTIHITLLGGGFGRRLNADFSVEAAAIAREVAAPVQVVWTREDDLGHDFYRPCARHRLEACLDARGFPLALRHRLCNPGITATYKGDAATGLGSSEGEGLANAFYRVPHRKSEYTLLRSGVPRGWWRAVNTTHTTFALESFLDELAAAAGADPLDYRLALIDQPPAGRHDADAELRFVPDRMKRCLALAAERAGWGRALPAGHGLGLACGGFDHMSYAAMVVEASMAAGRVAVHRVVCAVDCGTVIHPSGARAQIEGAVTQGLSAALYERMAIDGGRAMDTNFHSYRLLRFHEAPARIDVHFVDRPGVRVTGLGEPALPPVAPALANALYRATGRRLRELPLAVSA